MKFDLTNTDRIYCLDRDYILLLQENGFKVESRAVERNGGTDYYAAIEIDSLEELLRLMTVTGQRLVILPLNNGKDVVAEIEIYDGDRD